MPNVLDVQQIAEFNTKGFTYARGLFAPDEVKLLTDAMEKDPAVRSSILDRRDGEGRSTRIALWNRAGDSVYGLAARTRRMVDTSAELLGGPVYHYQSKLTAKEPEVGGAWEWHQDYGYLYHNECLYPDMASCYIAVDRAYRSNGCLQILRGSHRLGRIEHGRFGTQVGADPGRVELAMRYLDLVYCEMSPGTALFFHANLLHRSDPNTSDDPRWSLICCYNTKHNPCKDRPGHPSYRPLEKWNDSRIRELGRRQALELTPAG